MDSDNDMRYIRPTRSGTYGIYKNIKRKPVSFGTYDSLRTAIILRDFFMENNWDIVLKDKILAYKQNNGGEFLKYISKTKHDDYIITKGGIYYGKFDSLIEAIESKKYLEDNNWSIELKKKFQRRNVSDNELIFIQELSNNTYGIRKNVNGRTLSFGTYSTLEEAKTARDYFNTHGWNVSERFRFVKVKDKEEEEANKSYFKSRRLF